MVGFIGKSVPHAFVIGEERMRDATVFCLRCRLQWYGETERNVEG